MNDSFPSTEIQSFLTHLTTASGVYRMLDASGEVLYVGKAFNLKKRVSSYFKKNHANTKTRSLVQQIAKIDVTVTQSDTEALLLESSLIKTLRPKYNILMRDDKSYPYIVVSTQHAFPRMDIVRFKKKPKKGTYFGPYPNATAVRETLNIIQKIFKIRNCSDVFFSGRRRPCLQHQIKRCSAPCVDAISKKSYQVNVQHAMDFLQGKNQRIIKEMAEDMDKAVAILAFEEAAILRDQIKQLRLTQEQQGVTRIRGDADVIAMEVQSDFACIQCLTVREGEILASASFFPSMPKLPNDDDPALLRQQVFEAFISHYYVDAPERIPPVIVAKEQLIDKRVLEAMLTELRGKICKIQTKPRGDKSSWHQFAMTNLRHVVSARFSSEALLNKRYQALVTILDLKKPIHAMECFDISHTQGTSTVASCVVFNERGPCKKAYRRFNITGIQPGDDYAAIEQAIVRRARHWKETQRFPDVLVIDGGKGQVNVVKRLFNTLDIQGIFLLGIAKGPKRKAGMERLILMSQDREITLPQDSPALHLLQHIRDESHRFAITAHRKQRKKTGLGSSLSAIEGIGPKRRQALLRYFGGIRELAKAPVGEIAKVTGISNELAEKISQHLKSEKN